MVAHARACPQWGDWKIAVGDVRFSATSTGMLTMCATKWNGVEAVCWISAAIDYDVALYFWRGAAAGSRGAATRSGFRDRSLVFRDPGISFRAIDVHLPYAGRILQTMHFLGSAGRVEIEIPWNAPNDGRAGSLLGMLRGLWRE